jgi:hypothetical protein
MWIVAGSITAHGGSLTVLVEIMAVRGIITVAYIPNAGTPSAIQLRTKALEATMYLDSPLGNVENGQEILHIPADSVPHQWSRQRSIQ